jgi:hypothetical protein
LVVNCGGSIIDGDEDAPPALQQYGSWGVDGWQNPRACAGSAGGSGVPTYTFWQDGFEFPRTVKANLGYERKLFDRTLVSLDLLLSESTGLYTVRNLNLRDVQFQLSGEGGRRVFMPESTFDPTSSSNPTPAYRNTDFGPVYVNYNDGRARSFVTTLEAQQQFREGTWLRGSYTFTRAYDNSSYSCCTASSGHGDPTVGVYGPNEVGGIGDKDRAWGPSDFMRAHTFVVAGSADLPHGFQVSGSWRIQSGRPYTPEIQGDLNGDGLRYNDRPFIFAPADLPLASAGTAEEADERAAYQKILKDHPCVGDYVGQVVPRGTCRMPWTNQMDMRVEWEINTIRGQRGSIQLDLFNVLNGINNDWGRWVGVYGSDRNLLSPTGYDAATGRVLYSVYEDFGTVGTIGSNLNLQFSAQIGFRYYF